MITILVVIYIVFISLGLPDSLFGVAWPIAHIDFGINQNFASLYSIVTGVCSGGAGLFAGRILRKFGTPRVTLVSILLTAFGLVGMSFSGNIWVMMAFAVVLGLGAGAIDTGLNNYVSLHYKARHMSWLHCFWGVGVTASPLIMSGTLTTDVFSWRNGYRIVAIIQFAIAIIVLIFLSKWKKLDGEIHEEVSNSKSINPFKTKGATTSILTLGFYCTMEFLVGTWGATYLVNVFSLSPAVAAKWISVYFAGIMAGRLVSGFATMKFSDDVLITTGLIIAMFGFVLLVLPIGNIAFCGFFLIGFGFGPVFPSVLHSVPKRFGSEYSADLIGYHMGGGYAVGFAIQLAFGYIASATTFAFMPYMLMAFAFLALGVHKATEFKLKAVKE